MSTRRSPALANVRDSLLVLSGGRLADERANFTYITSRSVDIYEVRTDKWRKAPDLNKARAAHSSCFLGDFVYVAGGINKS